MAKQAKIKLANGGEVTIELFEQGSAEHSSKLREVG